MDSMIHFCTVEKKTSDVYQEMASNKVILVEQEEKANTASREQRFCTSILETTKDELEQVKNQVSILKTDVSDAKEREQACQVDVKERSKNNHALAKELKAWMGKYKKLEKKLSDTLKRPSKPVSPPRVHTATKRPAKVGTTGDDPLLYAAVYTNHIPEKRHAPMVNTRKKKTTRETRYRNRDQYEEEDTRYGSALYDENDAPYEADTTHGLDEESTYDE